MTGTGDDDTLTEASRGAVGTADAHLTVTEEAPGGTAAATTRGFRIRMLKGPGAGTIVQSNATRLAIGSHELNQLVLEDPTVSRFHCEISVDEKTTRVVDLRSKNGTFVNGVRVVEAFLESGSVLRLGRVDVQFENRADRDALVLSPRTSFGTLVGTSLAMRSTFARLERAAGSEATVLLGGETGTGKSKAALALHEQGARAGRPFVVIDCGAIPPSLLESELFGHEKGAFTGAEARRVGAFEEADGGTIFLDEIGELPPDLQPKLLRVLENHEIRRVGANRHVPVDVRVIAATNRDLRREVNEGRFRSDLYYRLAVVTIHMPAVRERPEDLPALVEQVLASLRADNAARARLLEPAVLQGLARAPWPGNVRELRNYIERSLVMPETAPPAPTAHAHERLLPFSDARRLAQAEFERRYLEDLLREHDGKVAEAAVQARVDRVYLYRLLRRHGMKPRA